MYQRWCCNCCESAAYNRSPVTLVTLVSNCGVVVLLSLSNKFSGHKFVTVWDLKVNFFFEICILFMALWFFIFCNYISMLSFSFFWGNSASSHASKNTICILSRYSNLIDYPSLSCSNISIKCTVTANANQTFIAAVVTLYSEIHND